MSGIISILKIAIDIYASLAIIVVIMVAAIAFSVYKNGQIEKAAQT